VALQLGGRQQRAVLALLAAEAGRVVSLPRIADALWGERVPTGFAATVQTYVFHLREALEPARERGAPARLLVTEPGGYRLSVDDEMVDVARFEQQVHDGQDALDRRDYTTAATLLRDALDLWRGDVLADLADFAFVAPLAARLEQRHRSAAASRVMAELALGHHGALIGEIDELVVRYPLDEDLHADRILALYRCERQSDALAAYLAVRTALRDELGVEPGPVLQQLHHDMLARDPSLDWQPPETGDQHQATAGGRERPAPRRPLLGRFRRRRWVLGAGAAVVVLTAGSIAGVVAMNPRHSSLRALPANSVGAIQADGSLHDAVPVGQNPDGIAYGANYLWAVNTTDNTVSQINPRSHEVVQLYPVGAAPAAVAIANDNAWVANTGANTVTRINVDARQSVGEPIRVGTQPDAIASGPSGVWVANSADGTIQHINPDTGRVDKPVPVGSDPDGLAVDANAVWVADGASGFVSRIDPATSDDLGSTEVGAGPKGIALSDGSAWVANQASQNVTRIDADTGHVLATIPVGEGPDSIVASGKYLWVSDAYDGTVAKINPRSNVAVHRFALGASPHGLASKGSSVWAAAGAFADHAHVGGTLTIDSNAPGFNAIDPSSAYLAFREERMVYDGLVTYRRVGGVAGQTLVPDLATDLPPPTDGGKTYTFRIRPGVRYSDGRLVQASDLLRGVQRALVATGGNPSYFAGIVGGASCIAHPKQPCDLSRGIVVDDRARRVIFHLTAPDPDFRQELTIFAVATPPPPWPKVAGHSLPPATGPYRIAGYQSRGKLLTLARNRYFHQWSFAAQPAGYPDVITWRLNTDARAQVNAVVAGRADATSGLTGSTATPQQLTASAVDLQTQYPRQFHTEFEWAVAGEELNLRLPPFNDIRVRRALNYAVDRRTVNSIEGGATQAELTCQVLPPRFPGYQPYCPYTTPPLDGAYHGPDLVRAKQLIPRQDKGMHVTVWRLADFPPVTAYLVKVLDQLGFRATERVLRAYNLKDFQYIFGPSTHTQIACCWGWGSDFPTPANFFTPGFLGCPASSNYFGYCNPRVEALITRAQAAQTVDPVAANRLWAQIDRIVVDDAPEVFDFVAKTFTFTSARVGNYQSNLETGPLWDQMWVR
jgi:YVTN family beta-propeller protein